MSQHTARQVAEQMDMRPCFLEGRYAGNGGTSLSSSGFMADLDLLAKCDPAREIAEAKGRGVQLAGAYGFAQVDDRKPFVFADGKAIIPIHGLLINRFAYSWSFITGYNFVRAQVEAAMSDADVDGIIYDVNTRGGMVAGCKETADIIYAASKAGGGKRSLAVIDAACYSAGYYVTCGADSMACTPSGGVGSIGVLLGHVDVSVAMAKDGVKVTFVVSPKGGHKTDGNPYEPLSAEVEAAFQAENDKAYDVFVSSVVRSRPQLSEADVRGTQARCYQADDALSLRLIDSVATPPEALNDFFNAEAVDDDAPGDDDDNQEDDPNMANATPVTTAAAPDPAVVAASNAAAATEARTNEKARIAGIMGHPEAKDRGKLAHAIAMESDMSAETAGKLLAASPTETPPAAAAPPAKQEPSQEANHFKNAMDAGKHPNTGANDGSASETGGGEAPSAAQRILASQAKFQGQRKVAAK